MRCARASDRVTTVVINIDDCVRVRVVYRVARRSKYATMSKAGDDARGFLGCCC